jgi:hypothetical protein
MIKALLFGILSTLCLGITLDQRVSVHLYGLNVSNKIDYNFTSCEHTIQRKYDSFETLIKYPMSQIDQHGQATLEKMEDAIQLEDDIDDLSIVLGTLKTSVTELTILPVVGGVMSTLITTLQAGAVKKMKKSIKSFNRAVVDKIKPITEELLQKNAALAEKIATAKFIMSEYVFNDHCRCHDSDTRRLPMDWIDLD